MFHVKQYFSIKGDVSVSIDFQPILDKYETYVVLVDGIFDKVRSEYGQYVTCKPG